MARAKTAAKPAASLTALAAGATGSPSSVAVSQAAARAFVERAAREAIAASVELDVSIAQRYEVRVSEAIATACWEYRPPHRITLGSAIYHRARPGASDAERGALVREHLHHEFAHLLWTERDPERVRAALPARATLRLWNWFEDVRVEQRWREATGRRFGWSALEPEGMLAPVPLALLGELIWHEGDVLALASRIAADADAAADPQAPSKAQALRDMLARVHPFYVRAAHARDGLALMPLMAEWIEQFGNAGLDGLADSHRIDVVILLGGEAGDVPLLALLGAAVATVPERRDGAKHGPAALGAVAQAGSGDLLACEAEPFDAALADRVAGRLAPLFAARERRAYTDQPTHRLSAQRMGAGRAECYVTRAATRRARAPVLAVVDCSGSMEGEHMDAARVLVAALSRLAARGAIRGHVVLSAVCPRTYKAVWQRFALPLADHVIERIQAFGAGEGLANALAAHYALAREARLTAVVTDGAITDAPIDKAALHARGIHTVGLYCGGDEALPRLAEWFDRALVRPDAQRLAEALVTMR